jgi:hypothetical protein
VRTAEIAAHGYRVIRFWNNAVIDNLDGVLDAIQQALADTPPHPDPLRPGGAYRIHTSLFELELKG